MMDETQQAQLEALQAHYRSTGQALKGKDAEKFLRQGSIGVPSGQKRKRGKKEYWQTPEWWESLDASTRQRVHEALSAHYRKTGRRRPRKPEMEKLIKEAIGTSKLGKALGPKESRKKITA
jgi:hypothetical protein